MKIYVYKYKLKRGETKKSLLYSTVCCWPGRMCSAQSTWETLAYRALESVTQMCVMRMNMDGYMVAKYEYTQYSQLTTHNSQ